MNDMKLLGLVVLALAASTAALQSREEVSFNLGWRFKHGDPPGSVPECPSRADGGAGAGWVNVSAGVRCTNQTFAPLNTLEDCRRACCPHSPYFAPVGACTSYQFVGQNPFRENTTQGCYLAGADADCVTGTPTSIMFEGAYRDRPVPPPAADAYAYSAGAAAFDDSAWRRVDVPHDFVVERGFNAAELDGGKHGFLPRAQPGWYRKHFRIPAAWRAPGVRVRIRFNGIFHLALANGQALIFGGVVLYTRAATTSARVVHVRRGARSDPLLSDSE